MLEHSLVFQRKDGQEKRASRSNFWLARKDFYEATTDRRLKLHLDLIHVMFDVFGLIVRLEGKTRRQEEETLNFQCGYYIFLY